MATYVAIKVISIESQLVEIALISFFLTAANEIILNSFLKVLSNIVHF